jgi:hypothetical protein
MMIAGFVIVIAAASITSTSIANLSSANIGTAPGQIHSHVSHAQAPVLATSPISLSTDRPVPSVTSIGCCRLAEAGNHPQPRDLANSGGGSAEGGENANVAAWVIGVPGGGVQAPSGYSITDCSGWVFATDMPDLAGSTIAGGMRLDPDGVLAYLYQRDCGPDPVRQYVWVRQESPSSIARAAEQNLRIRLLPAPIPQLSPPNQSVVHLETWLAVQPVAAVTVTADIPGMWISVTARVASTTFDFGDGILITCAGTGQIWNGQAHTTAAGCGHTFRAFDPPGRNRTVRIWLNWSVTWASSTGESGTLDSVSSASRVIAHPVREIQTIGIRG